MKSDKTTPNVPTLRFQEFTDPWTLMPLKKLLCFQNGINADSAKYGKGVKFISVSDILNNQYITYDCIKGMIDIDKKTMERFLVEYGDILFQRSSETFEDIGRANVYLDKEHPATFGGFVIRGKKISEYNPMFFRYLLCTPNARKQTVRMGAGAQHYNIGQDGLGKISLYFPTIQEQQKIAGFLSAIDDRISVQNKIIEDLKVLKKELCAKLFGSPLCGRIIAIEQVADIYGGYAFNSKAYVNKGKYKIVTIGNVTGDKYISGNYNTIDRLPNNIQKPQVLSKGDILVSLTGNVGRISIVDGDEYLLNQRVAKLGIEDDLTKEYIYQYLSNSSFEKDMINAGQGAAQKNIKNQDILSYCIRFPTDQTALENIDKLLSLYDIRITSEKAILSNLILQKSYYLRAMFI